MIHFQKTFFATTHGQKLLMLITAVGSSSGTGVRWCRQTWNFAVKIFIRFDSILVSFASVCVIPIANCYINNTSLIVFVYYTSITIEKHSIKSKVESKIYQSHDGSSKFYTSHATSTGTGKWFHCATNCLRCTLQKSSFIIHTFCANWPLTSLNDCLHY